MHIWITILILTFIPFYKKANCYITAGPTDTEVLVNRSAYLNCSTSILSQEVTWYRYRVGDPYRRHDVYDAGVIDRSYRDRFYIDGDKTNGVFNLVIRRVLLDDAGKYECQDDGGIGDKRSAELVVLDDNGPVCQSNIPAEGLMGPNDCGFEPTTIELSCVVKFHGNSAPQMEWNMEQGVKETKFPQNTVSYNSTADQATCNLTVKAELQMNQSSIVCKTTGSTPHKCAVEVDNVLYAFDNNTGTDVTMNEKVTCFANSSQPCSYRWKWFEWKYDILVASNSELTVAREGWHRCEAECHFGMRTCLIEAMVIHVFSPSTAGPQQDSKTAVSVLATIVVFLLLFIIIGSIIFLIFRKRCCGCTVYVDRRRNSPKRSESKTLQDEPLRDQEVESAGLESVKLRNTSVHLI